MSSLANERVDVWCCLCGCCCWYGRGCGVPALRRGCRRCCVNARATTLLPTTLLLPRTPLQPGAGIVDLLESHSTMLFIVKM
jgi:hypothetical protein